VSRAARLPQEHCRPVPELSPRLLFKLTLDFNEGFTDGFLRLVAMAG